MIYPLLVWAEVNLKYLADNLKLVRSYLKKSKTQIMAIVKADAYGHGMLKISEVLRGQGVSFFGVANIDEATELRKVCPKESILVLGSFHPNQVAAYKKYKIIPTVSCGEDLKALEKNLSKRAKRFPVHMKVDTGMGRLGVWHEDATHLFEIAKRCQKIKLDGVYTHFANADHRDLSRTRNQLSFFNSTLKKIKRLGFSPRYVHAANSMGLLRFKEARFNLARPGIILYGIDPSKSLSYLKKLKPILSLKTRIAFLKKIKKGETVSYGSTYKTTRDTMIATLPVGYSHGYKVGFSNKASVIIKNKKYPIVGRVTMDQTLVDVGLPAKVKRWDEVVLIGQKGHLKVTSRELAEIIGSIPYEITCSLHSRIPRIYKGF